MKTFNKILMGLASTVVLLSGCSDFEDLNNDPTKVDKEKVRTHYLLNKSIVDAQQNPHIAERIFVYQWKSAARFERRTGMAVGTNYDEYNGDYLGVDYGVGWFNDVNLAINLSRERLESGDAFSYEHNVLQMSRIWRAYIISELSDCFGPVTIENKYDGVIEYKDQKTIYEFILSELKDAAAQLDPDADMSEIRNAGTDPFYSGDVSKWVKYANSMRLRYAMRLSEVEPEMARQAFEETAQAGNLISTLSETAEVQEVDSWSGLAGVMSRGWNPQPISVTLNNLMIGLGGIDFQVPSELEGKITLKDARTYLGQELTQHLSTNTNDPAAGFFFDALPAKIDPRATVLFHIPGYDDGQVYFPNIELAEEAQLLDPETKEEVDKNGNRYIVLKTQYTWNTWVTGKWDEKRTLAAKLINETENYPSLSKQYREHTKKRVWFAPWETYFLLAEAAHYGWNVPGSVKDNYEAGITASFEYHGVTQFLDAYLSSQDYNRVGTSVAIEHTAEAQPYTVEYVDGYTGEQKTKTYYYPKNSIYKNGAYNNDVLTKIISQKYLAQMPWLPLETWSDHRRLGLPFFENPAVEVSYNTSSHEVALTTSNYMECRWEFYTERFMYPSSLEVNSSENYNTAVRLLGGENKVATPLWWTNRK